MYSTIAGPVRSVGGAFIVGRKFLSLDLHTSSSVRAYDATPRQTDGRIVVWKSRWMDMVATVLWDIGFVI